MQGFSLLEVLVALLVLSIGLLGLAGLSAKGMSSNQSAYYLSQAMVQAYDMADRMRANRVGFAAPNNSYDDVSGIPGDPGCISTGCLPPQIAQYDLYKWNTANANLLPSGQGKVDKAGNIRIITVMWDEDRTGATGTACGGGSADLTCFRTSFVP